MEKNSMKVVSDGTVARGDSLETDRVESHIITIRGVQVILDRDLARMYQVEVSQMNRQVKRNKKRFPSDFMFQLTKQENESLKCQFGISNARGGDRALPYAFTEQGVASLSGLLRSDTAIEANIQIMRAFVAMRRFLAANAEVFQRAHDRFLIIDERVYHVGASLKDLGKKWFAVSLMEALDAGEMLSRLQNLV